MSAQPSSTSTSTPIPGAALPSTTKPKRSKKRPTSKNAEVAATSEEPPVATSSHVQEEAKPVTPTVNGTVKEKGPVEEVIAKRMRQLNKKILRFKEYASRPHDSLNADQKAGINSLPTLISAYKELEELTKQVEPVELEQAGKVRELKDQARQEAEGTVAGKISEFQASLSTPLSSFLRLHRLLHPARSSDHENLTFARLDLPSSLEDEVQATDVLRVGRMYEDLIAGGERGSEVIAGLVRGSTGEDEENDHVHHLLSLIPSSDAPADQSTTEEVDLQESQPAPEVEEPVSKAPSDDGIANGDVKEEEVASTPTAVDGQSSGGALNFLQADELAEEEFEIVPRLNADQTSGLQPPQEPITTVPPPPLDATPVQSVNGSSEPALFNPSTNFDWAADEDLDEATEAAHIRQAFALPPSGTQTPALQSEPQGRIEEQTIPAENEEPAIALVQENELANAHISESAVDAPTSVESGASIPAPPVIENKDVPVQGKNQRGRGTGQNRNRGGRNASGRGQGQNQSQNQNHNQNQPQGQTQKVQGKPSVDEDGFQVVGRQLPPPVNRGRGGNPNGRGRGDGARGRGGQTQNGRGRGGPGPRGPPRNNSTAGPAGEGQNQGQQGNRPPRQPRQPSQAQPKTPAPTTA